MVGFGALRGVKVYEAFMVGAKEGFQLALGIIPYLVAVLAVVSMLRASGGIAALVDAVGGIFSAVGMPAEVLPLALLRPLTGSGAFAITAELAKTHGADSAIGLIATTMNGSTETTFYVLAVYFGSVGVTRARYALAAGLTADIVGAIVSVVAVNWLLL
ncbi:MAG: spore maturation protein [Myxococcales bacterium]|nr:spore maturation protein [Myxococcales bacterium]